MDVQFDWYKQIDLCTKVGVQSTTTIINKLRRQTFTLSCSLVTTLPLIQRAGVLESNERNKQRLKHQQSSVAEDILSVFVNLQPDQVNFYLICIWLVFMYISEFTKLSFTDLLLTL